jgi:GH18 family chitinase
MQRISTLKSVQPDLKIWITIGGRLFSDSDQPTAKTFSILSASKPRQQVFAKSLVSMMSTYGFDGVDIDWVSRLPLSLVHQANDIKVSYASLWLQHYILKTHSLRVSYAFLNLN